MIEQTREAYPARIRVCIPDLTIVTARFLANGQNNDILIVNDSLVFRFPRYTAAIARLQGETALLSSIQPIVPLPVPRPVYASFDPPAVGQAFMGYAMLPGEPLWCDALATCRREAIAAIAARLAAFLRALHTTPASSLPADLPTADGSDYWRDMYGRIRAKLFPYMRPDARTWATQHFETFLDEPRNTAWTTALRHGDFGPSNILYDPATESLTGIIDFGSAALGDPAVDIAPLSGYGPAFLDLMYDAYPAMRAAAARVAFYAGTFALQEALFGIEHGDPDAFAAGIASYR